MRERIGTPPCPVEKTGTEVLKPSGARWVYYAGTDERTYLLVTTEMGLPEWYLMLPVVHEIQ